MLPAANAAGSLGGEKFNRPLGGLRPGAPDDVLEDLDLPAHGQDERRGRRGPPAPGPASVGESVGLSTQS